MVKLYLFKAKIHFILVVLITFLTTFTNNIKCSKINVIKTSDTIKNILFLTDIHLDVLYDSKQPFMELTLCRKTKDILNNTIDPFDYGRYNCNPTVHLLESALTKANETYNKNIDYIILGGDMIAHGLYELNLTAKGEMNLEINKELFKETFTTIYKKIKQYFPEAFIIPVLGNNDFYEHYATPDKVSLKEQTDFLKDLYFPEFIKEKLIFNDNFDNTISNGFYYSITLDNIKYISLNSNYFCKSNKRLNDTEALIHLDFLSTELALSKNKSQKVIMLQHIPSYPSFYEGKIEFNILEKYAKIFESITYKYRNIIITNFSGHLHKTKVGVSVKSNKDNKNTKSFLKDNSKSDTPFYHSFSFPSISPVYYNNPGFSIINLDIKIGQITDIQSIFADLKKTLNEDLSFSLNKEINADNLFDIKYNYREDYKFNKFNSEDYYDFIYNRLEDEELLHKYFFSMLGFRLGNYTEYTEILRKTGSADLDNHNLLFKKSMKVIYVDDILP